METKTKVIILILAIILLWLIALYFIDAKCPYIINNSTLEQSYYDCGWIRLT